MVPRRVVQHVAVEPDGSVQIGFYTPAADLKASGVAQMHTILVPAGDEYDEEIEAVMDAVHHLIDDVLDSFPHLPGLGDPP